MLSDAWYSVGDAVVETIGPGADHDRQSVTIVSIMGGVITTSSGNTYDRYGMAHPATVDIIGYRSIRKPGYLKGGTEC